MTVPGTERKHTSGGFGEVTVNSVWAMVELKSSWAWRCRECM